MSYGTYWSNWSSSQKEEIRERQNLLLTNATHSKNEVRNNRRKRRQKKIENRRVVWMRSNPTHHKRVERCLQGYVAAFPFFPRDVQQTACECCSTYGGRRKRTTNDPFPPWGIGKERHFLLLDVWLPRLIQTERANVDLFSPFGLATNVTKKLRRLQEEEKENIETRHAKTKRRPFFRQTMQVVVCLFVVTWLVTKECPCIQQCFFLQVSPRLNKEEEAECRFYLFRRRRKKRDPRSISFHKDRKEASFLS